MRAVKSARETRQPGGRVAIVVIVKPKRRQPPQVVSTTQCASGGRVSCRGDDVQSRVTEECSMHAT